MCFLITTYVKKFSSHFIFFLLACNPCFFKNITSLQTIRLNTIISVYGSAQRDNYLRKKLKTDKEERGP